MLLQHELEELLNAPVYTLECMAQIEATYITTQTEPMYEDIYQTGWCNIEIYKFFTDDFIKIPLEFRIDQRTSFVDRVEHVISRVKRERFDEYKFCYRRDK